jgi:hypothetical protein
MKTIIETIFYAVTATLVSSCACKIEPPPSVMGTSREGAAKVAADSLGSSVAKGEISGNYTGVVNRTYVTVAQDDVAFYLLLQAYNCESRRGHKEAANALLQTAREELARRHNATPVTVAAHPTTLTPTEEKVLSRSPLKEEISNKIAAPPSP